MVLNPSIFNIGYLINLAILCVFFLFLFRLICTTPGKSKCQVISLLITMFGTGTCLGAQVVPHVVDGAWAALGPIALVIGWVVFLVADLIARQRKQHEFR